MTYKEFQNLKPDDKIKCIFNKDLGMHTQKILKNNEIYIVSEKVIRNNEPRIKISGQQFKNYAFRIYRFDIMKKRNIG